VCSTRKSDTKIVLQSWCDKGFSCEEVFIGDASDSVSSKEKRETRLFFPQNHVSSLLLRKHFYQQGTSMKMNSQSRSFVKQVQMDLLALDDANLSHMVQQWIGGNISAVSLEVPEDTYLALGYTHILAEAKPLTLDQCDVPESEDEGSTQWYAPSAYHLRTLLSAMDANLFARHIITFAFESLHPLYPEWHEGVIFNAHLANYLRRIKEKTANQDQGTK
jgi:hypothetical protein